MLLSEYVYLIVNMTRSPLQIPNAHHLPLSLLLTLLTEICSVCVHFRRNNLMSKMQKSCPTNK